MEFNRAYLKYLSILSLLFLGGCSWVADLQWPNREGSNSDEHHPNAQVGPSANDSLGEPNHESLFTDTTNTTTPLSSETTQESDISASSGINHGERLSTLNDGLPPGRLPPDIVPATGEEQRLPEIEPGRSDPFASLPARPFLVHQRPVASTSVAGPTMPPTDESVPTPPLVSTGQPPVVPPSPQTVETVVPVPIASQFPTPSLTQRQPSVPRVPVPTSPVPTSPVPTSPVPTSPVPAAPSESESVSVASASPSSPSFEFSGVVQLGDRVNIIVEEPSGSRYVQIGERVGNGQFVIKAVDFNQGSIPAVVLERGGTQSIHWVGNPIAL